MKLVKHCFCLDFCALCQDLISRSPGAAAASLCLSPASSSCAVMNLSLEHAPAHCACGSSRWGDHCGFPSYILEQILRGLPSLLTHICFCLILLAWIWDSQAPRDSQLPISGDAIAVQIKQTFMHKPLKTVLLVGLFFSRQFARLNSNLEKCIPLTHLCPAFCVVCKYGHMYQVVWV